MATKNKILQTMVLAFASMFFSSCVTTRTVPDEKPVSLPTAEEISLKKDRSDLDQIRADIPEEVRQQNDEWALILKDMDGVKSPYEARSRYYDKVRRHRERFNEDMRRVREDFNKSEQRQRKAFLDILEAERKTYEKSKHNSDDRKAFFDDHSDRRKIFFENQQDKRKDFESSVTEKRKDFEDYMKDKQKQFDDAIREYTKNFDARARERRQLENAKIEAQRKLPKMSPAPTAVQYDGQEKDLQDIRNIPQGGQPLAPEDE